MKKAFQYTLKISLCASFAMASTVFLNGQYHDNIIKKNKVSKGIIQQSIYNKKKRTNTITSEVYYDKNGYDTLIVSGSDLHDRHKNTYDSQGRIIKRIGMGSQNKPFDSCIYIYMPDSNYEMHTFYYDSTFASSIKFYDQKDRWVKETTARSRMYMQFLYDSLGRKIKTIFHQEDGRQVVQQESQTLDKNGRLIIDNKNSWGGPYEVYEYYDNGLIKRILTYFDRAKTKRWDYQSKWVFYE